MTPEYDDKTVPTALPYPQNLMVKLFGFNRDMLSDSDKLDRLIAVLDNLNPTQAECIEMYFKDGLTLRQIAKKYGFSHQRAAQIVNKGIERLYNFFDQPDEDEESLLTLGLSTRPYNCLIKYGIRTIKELTSMSKLKLSSMRNLGEKSYKEILDTVEKRGLSFQEDPDPDSFIPSEDLLQNLDLSVYSYDCLKNNGIKTIGELTSKPQTELFKMRGIGYKSFEEIVGAVKARGLSFCDDPKVDA